MRSRAVIDAGHDPRRFATDLLERFRDLIVLQAVPDAAARGVVDAPGDVLERMRDQAARLGAATLTRYAEVVHAGLGEMRGATAPRLLLEVVCARLLLPSASDTESALLQRVERIETRLDMSIPADSATSARRGCPLAKPPKQFVRKTKAAAPPPEEPRARSREPVVPDAVPIRAGPNRSRRKPSSPHLPSPPPGAAARRTRWWRHPQRRRRPPWQRRTRRRRDPQAVVDGAGQGARHAAAPLAVMLAGAIVRAVDGGTLVLSHESAPLAKRLDEQRNADVVQEALKDALGVGLKVRYEVGAAGAGAGDGAQPRPMSPRSRATKRRACWPRPAATPPRPMRRDPEEAALELLQNELGARDASTAASITSGQGPPRPQRQPAVVAVARRA